MRDAVLCAVAGAVFVWVAGAARSRARMRTRARAAGSCLSLRGEGLSKGPGPPGYIWEHIMRLGDVYCPQERPGGYICLAISENRLAYPLYKEALAAARPTGRWIPLAAGPDLRPGGRAPCAVHRQPAPVPCVCCPSPTRRSLRARARAPSRAR